MDPLKTKNKSTPPEDNDSAVISAVEGIFKTVEPSKITKLPPLSSELDIFKGLSSRGEHNVNISVSLPDEDNIQYRWFRKLDNTAAQQVRSPKSNPTGNLRLTQGEFNIDHKVYFRNCFFDKLPWHSNNKNLMSKKFILRSMFGSLILIWEKNISELATMSAVLQIRVMYLLCYIGEK